jgi:poly-gamma-glutamate capsule biosynthesis protein CapA/YwtB (metallophosphatase superfamily)
LSYLIINEGVAVRYRENTRRKKWSVLSLTILLIILAAFIAWGQWGGSPPSVAPQDNQVTQQPELSPEWTFVANGDLMLSRRVAVAMKEKGSFYPFEQMAPLLNNADLTFGNLETSLSNRGTPIPGKGIWFRCDPAAAKALKEAGYDVLSIANNHILDYDSPALLDTLEALHEQGIDPVGGGKDLEEAVQPVIKDVKGQKIAFIAATEMADIFWSYQYPRTFEAKPDLPGVQKFDADELVNTVSSLRDQVDIIVVSLHWGTEYSDYPEVYQKETAHRLVDAGAKLVIGHHPHCLQGVEMYKGSFIAYSLGNFVFDKQRRPKCWETVLVKTFFQGNDLQKVELYPVMIADEQPRPAAGDDAVRILQKMKKLSSELETSLDIDDKIGAINLVVSR